MDNIYCDTLNTLLKKKSTSKTKSPTVADQENYFNAWLNLASEVEFNDTAISLLFQGFSFCGSSALFKFLQKTPDPQRILATLFNSKLYLTDNTSFKILLHLLALLLNSRAPSDLIAQVIEQLPEASLNKEHKLLGTAAKSYEKYFLSELNQHIDLIPLNKLGISSDVLNPFIDLFTSLNLKEEITAKGSDRTMKLSGRISLVKTWLNAYPRDQSLTNNPTQVEIHSTECDATSTTTSETAVTVSIPDDLGKPVVHTEIDNSATSAPLSADHALNLLTQVQHTIKALQVNESLLSDRNEVLSEELENKQKKVAYLEEQVECQNVEIISLESRLTTADADRLMYKQVISEKNKLLQEKEFALSERDKMIDVLRRDRARQSGEVLQKLASKLRPEYMDFSDAESIAMDCELGENMRVQLRNIFNILEENGIKIR